MISSCQSVSESYFFTASASTGLSELFFDEEKLTKKGAGPGDRGGVALEEHQDTVESRLRGERRNVFVELRATEEDMRGNSSYKVEYPLVTLNVDVIRCKKYHTL